MTRVIKYGLLALAAIAAANPASAAADVRHPAQKDDAAKTFLHKDWQAQSSCDDKAAAEKISTAGFDASKWHRTDIPATVVGVLVTDKTLPDPNYGPNLKNFPGMYFSEQVFFANVDMPDGSPFACSWWYRTEFKLPTAAAASARTPGKTEWLHFNGINYRANIWLNGQKVADAKDVAGTYRTFEFNVSKFLKHGAPNTLAVEVFAPGKDDLGITWVDWNPTPPDKNMGIWKEVFLTQSADVTVRNPFVASKLTADYKSAALTVAADLQNMSAHPVKGILRATIDKATISQPVTLTAGETRTVRFTAEKFAALKLAHPRLWWPYTMGEPNLYNAKLTFQIGGRTSDSASTTFGIREVTSELTDQGHRLFKIKAAIF
jgi:exo-1,4-beta-D-glucosaminidase